MSNNNLFDDVITFPDPDWHELYHSLVGLDEEKERLAKEASLILKPDTLTEWAKRFHDSQPEILEQFKKRPPLFVFAGDVGTGKTALAKSFGAEVARRFRLSIELYPLSLKSRGTGAVGEMTQLLSLVFSELISMASPRQNKKAYILLIDEADAIAQSRELAQMHHEDRAGVNTLLRGIDDIASAGLPIVIVMCTNRSSSLDPAVKRRAAAIFDFKRPNKEQRYSLLGKYLSPIGFTDSQISELVDLTGGDLPYTYSDITQRLLPSIVLASYPENAISFELAKSVTLKTKPTPEFIDS